MESTVLSNDAAELSPKNVLKTEVNHSEENYGEPDFSNIVTSTGLEESLSAGQGDVEVPVGKSPKRILHFSDGMLEEYSTDEEDIEEVDTSRRAVSMVDPKTLPWKSWIWYQTVLVGSTSLRVCDYLGESLANFFGITTPKYQYEIDEYNRNMEEEEAERKKQELEMKGWTDENKGETVHTIEQRF